jgi:hypothetical protein
MTVDLLVVPCDAPEGRGHTDTGKEGLGTQTMYDQRTSNAILANKKTVAHIITGNFGGRLTVENMEHLPRTFNHVIYSKNVMQ